MSTVEQARAVPFVVLGETGRRRLADDVRARMQRWRSQWIPDQKLDVRVEVLEAAESARALRLHDAACFRMVGGACPGLVLLVPARCMPQILGLLGDAGECIEGLGTQHGMAEQLALAALRALVREFRTAEIPEPSVERLPGTAVEVQREYAACRYASVHVTLGGAKYSLLLLVSPELMSVAIPLRALSGTAERVERRRAAIADEVIGIEAVLGDGEVAVSELARLAVGDVIVLDQKLNESACLSIRGGGRLIGAAPGKLDGMRAVQIKRGTP